ncbi:MAG: CoB--CoM heterodisulfide reductase iron-sulfur subunit A family protein [Bacteroidales bacterium]|nr:CoB--CoM heterodisulfide reductase iron-sulfur subunit A family protein [Bacteroidales bacterium]
MRDPNNLDSSGKTVIIIGGGVAGMTAASRLADLGEQVILIEQEEEIGGHLLNWDRLFPNRRPGYEVLDSLRDALTNSVEIRCSETVSTVIPQSSGFQVILQSEESLFCDALLLATGFDLFDATKKEEYGYGIYENVITSADLEMMFRSGRPITTSRGKVPERVGFVHCVGSRDEKVGNLYCSKVCCVTGVKQAIEIKEQLPQAELFGFYMDLRMYDRHFEEMYYEAQQKWDINFLRGRVSECAENQDQSIVLKIEDTLTSRPLKITVDLLVLLVGFVPKPETLRLASLLEIPVGDDRFLEPLDEHTRFNHTGRPGIFLAGTNKGPLTISNTIADASAAAIQLHHYLQTINETHP